MAQAIVQPRRIATNGTFLIRTGLGTLATLTVNRVGAGGNLCRLYDGVDASGTLIAEVDTTSALGTFIYDAIVRLGIFVETLNGTPADLTVGWA